MADSVLCPASEWPVRKSLEIENTLLLQASGERLLSAKSCLVLTLQPNVRTEVTLPDTEIRIGANLY